MTGRFMTFIADKKLLVGWLAGLATAGAVAAAGAAIIIFTGYYDITATTQHHVLVGWAAHTTMKNAVTAEANEAPPPPAFTRADVMAGAEVYRARCVACHGGPGVGRADWVSAMTPTPPYLVDASRRWSTKELYWIINHGVKMTAMPAWGEVEPRQSIWQTVAFIQAMPLMKPAEFQAIMQSGPPQAEREKMRPPAAPSE